MLGFTVAHRAHSMNTVHRAQAGARWSRNWSNVRMQFQLSTALLLTALVASWTAALINSWQLVRIEAQVRATQPLERELIAAGLELPPTIIAGE